MAESEPEKGPRENEIEAVLSGLEAALSELGAAPGAKPGPAPEPYGEAVPPPGVVGERPPEPYGEAVPPPYGPGKRPPIRFRSQKPLAPVLPAIAPSLKLKSISSGAPPPDPYGEAVPPPRVLGKRPPPAPPSPPESAAPEPSAEQQPEAVETEPVEEVQPEAVPEPSPEESPEQQPEVVEIEAAPKDQEDAALSRDSAREPAQEVQPEPSAQQQPEAVNAEAVGEVRPETGEGIPEGAPADQVRSVAFFYSSGAEAVLEEFLRSLDNMALKVSKKPIYLKRTGIQPWDPAANPSLTVEAVKSAGASAVVACLSAFNELQVSAFEQALSREGIFFRLIRAEEAGQRAVAVDLLVDLILIR